MFKGFLCYFYIMKTNQLQRFIAAQEKDYAIALSEIRNGRKSGHWMWYIFPQLKGLGSSPTSDFYGINGQEEAKEYLEHTVLGKRLIEISTALMDLKTNDAQQVMGSPDHLKLRSSMTLFASVPGSDPIFKQVLEKYFSGEMDKITLELMNK